MNQPGVFNITLQRRADYSVVLQFKDANNTPINLTNWVAAAQIWDSSRSTKYADFIIEYVDRITGRIRLKLGHAATTLLPYSSIYDVLLVDPAGERRYYLEGTITAMEGYTAVA